MKGIIILIFTIMSVKSHAQDINKEFLCGQKWFPEQYEEADGTVVSIPKEHQSEYIEYKLDGTFLSIEGKMLIKGTWVYNTSDNTVVVTQKINRNYPTKVISKIITLTSDKLVVISNDTGGDLLKIQFRHLKK